MRQRTDAIGHAFLAAKCRANGLRITPQRAAIYGALCRSASHPTAEQLHKTIRARFSHVSLDTVNRTLLTFAQIGLAEIAESYGSPRRYDPNLESHHHAHCIKCGTIVDFTSPHFDALKIPAEIRCRFTIISKKVIFNGVCSACRKPKATGLDN